MAAWPATPAYSEIRLPGHDQVGDIIDSGPTEEEVGPAGGIVRRIVEIGADHEIRMTIAIDITHRHPVAEVVRGGFGGQDQVMRGVGSRSAEEEEGAAAIGATGVIGKGAGQDVRVAIAVDVGTAGHRGAEQKAAERHGKRLVDQGVRCRPAEEDVDRAGVGGAGIVVGGADQDVIKAIGIDVARPGHAGREDVAADQWQECQVGRGIDPRATEVDERRAGVDAELVIAGRIDDEVGEAVPVDVTEAGQVGAETVAGEAGHDQIGGRIDLRAAEIEIGTSGRRAAAVIGRCPDEHVIVAVTVHIPDTGHRVAELVGEKLTGQRAGHPMHRRRRIHRRHDLEYPFADIGGRWGDDRTGDPDAHQRLVDGQRRRRKGDGI
ncbi:MAG: hypothetical protein FD129_2473, partial [bacterium]